MANAESDGAEDAAKVTLGLRAQLTKELTCLQVEALLKHLSQLQLRKTYYGMMLPLYILACVYV